MDDLTRFQQQVLSTNEDYLKLLRHELSAQEALDHKLRMVRWRELSTDKLLALGESSIEFNLRQFVDVFLALQIRVPSDQQKRLEDLLLPNTQLLAEALASQGKRLSGDTEYKILAGPGLDLAIDVNRTSKWTFEKWREIPEFSEYHYREDGVYYRGLFLRPGDIVLADVNLEGNFIFSMFPDPKGFCPHSGIIVFLEHAGRRLPAVIETFEKGLRAVPLNVFFNERYIAYGEIYRHRDVDATHTEKINRLAPQALQTAVGYNFYTEDKDRAYQSCTSVGRFILQDAGLTGIHTLSGIRQKGLKSNLARLGFTGGDQYFAPVDYLLTPEFNCVGWIDNHQFDRLLTRELIESRYRKLWEDGEIQLKRMPLMVHLNRFGIEQIQKRSLLGKIISPLLGFDHHSLPKGPTQMLAVVEMVEAVAGRAVEGLLPFVRERLVTEKNVNLQRWLDDPVVQRELAKQLTVPWL